MNNNKQTMKLYTEEQVIDVFEKYGKMSAINARNILDLSESIELPGHFEILDEARKEESSKEHYAFIRAVRWISNKIEGGNK